MPTLSGQSFGAWAKSLSFLMQVQHAVAGNGSPPHRPVFGSGSARALESRLCERGRPCRSDSAPLPFPLPLSCPLPWNCSGGLGPRPCHCRGVSPILFPLPLSSLPFPSFGYHGWYGTAYGSACHFSFHWFLFHPGAGGGIADGWLPHCEEFC